MRMHNACTRPRLIRVNALESATHAFVMPRMLFDSPLRSYV